MEPRAAGEADELIAGLTGGRGLYRWQRRLLDDWLDGRAWDAVDVPTGLGKTTVITLWLIARLLGADVPRRLVYVVDRRAVVDQATTEVDRLAERLDALIDGEGGRRRREALGLPEHGAVQADGKRGPRLPVSTLRGQHRDNRLWMDDPGAAAVVVGTVDMVGSRLLFEAYGVSRGMRPVHAGLLGLDTLVVLDEAHLVPPFKALLTAVSRLATEDAARLGEGSPLPPPLALMTLSATGRGGDGERVFRLDEADRAESAVAARLAAGKRLRLMPDATAADVARRLADQAWDYRLGEDGTDGRRVVVYCNSRQTAQAVADDLAKRCRDKAAYGRDAKLVELLVGERRYRERVQLTGDGTAENPGSPVFHSFDPGRHGEDFAQVQVPASRPAFLVATSAGEVGIDLDADDLVCDLVAWERMVQRLGRVNRRPSPGEARVAVIPVAKEKDAEDAVDDEALTRWRAPFVSPFWREDADGARDASPGALLALRALALTTPALADVLRDASTSEPLRPPLTRATVEAWSMTSLERHPGRPKIAPWLRGWEPQERPQTAVVWRRLFPLRRDQDAVMAELRDFFAAAPPHATETLDAPTWRVSELLRARAAAMKKADQGGRKGKPSAPDTAAADDGEDDELGSAESQVSASEDGRRPDPVVVLLGADRTVTRLYTRRDLEEIKDEALQREIAYGTVIVDARFGGLTGATNSGEAGGLLDARASQPPPTVDMREGWDLSPERGVGRRITFGDRPKRDRAWRLDEFRWAASDAETAPGLWVELWRGGSGLEGDAAVAVRSQRLSEHLNWTGVKAGKIADAVGLAPAWRGLLVAAAEAHDLGKARDLWQNAMNAPRDGDRPYAKTTGGGDGRALNGYRHEFGSVLDLLAETPRKDAERVHAAIRALPDDQRDLALHLIAAHHGHARPTVKPYDPSPGALPPSRLPPEAQAIALRFARLQARWGPWGLAWWEALLRAADWAASRALNADEPSGEAAAAGSAVELAPEVEHG